MALKETNSPIPIKRKPEEEVQFVSSKPVKKCRGSKDSPADAYRAVDQANISKVLPIAGHTRLGDASSRLGPSPPTDQQLHELSNFNRGVSLPSMENYVFPPPHDVITSPTSRSSPMLSPKQLPQAVALSQADSQPNPPAPSNANDSKPPAWLNASWEASGVPPQPSSMNLHMTVNQPMMTPCVQPPTPEPSAAARGEKDYSSTPERLADSAQCPELASHPGKQVGMGHTQQGHQHRPQDNPESVQAAQPSGMHKTYQSVQAASRDSPGQMPRTQPPSQQHTGNSNGYAVATAHPLPVKPPCFTCEQIRQQALHNKTNIYPLVGAASHMHHGWHGPEVAHLPHPALMQPAPFPNAGFGVSPDMAQNHMQRSQNLYHGPIPMGYGLTHMPAQGPYPPPMQRAFPVADMSTSDSGPVVSSHKLNRSPQLNVSQGSTTVPQTDRAQYNQTQSASSKPPATQPSSTAGPSPTPAAAPTPRPATPSPTEKHSQNLIVDIAETCEALFPWDDVAERHNVPRQKVVDTFAAIIQLPLIRCTTDKKRHGRLATNRLKDYTRGKNAMYMSSSASPATSPAPAHSDSSETRDKRPVLPGVVELANTMAPVGFPSTLTKKYPGTW